MEPGRTASDDTVHSRYHAAGPLVVWLAGAGTCILYGGNTGAAGSVVSANGLGAILQRIGRRTHADITDGAKGERGE